MKINNLYDCVIIGSGPAGLTAGIYLGRAGYKVLCVTGSEPGGTLNKISIIENYPGYPDGITGADLAQNMLVQADKFGTEFAYFASVKEYEKDGDNHPIEIILDDDNIIYSKSLINCSGGKPLTLGLDNEENFFNKGISFCATCDGPLYKDKNVAVIGGGNSAMEFASTLAKYCRNVYIIHRRNVLRADQAMVSKAINNSNVNLILEYNVTKLLSDNKETLSGVVCESSNGSTNKILLNVSALTFFIIFTSFTIFIHF